jgi:hypothetical protein
MLAAVFTSSLCAVKSFWTLSRMLGTALRSWSLPYSPRHRAPVIYSAAFDLVSAARKLLRWVCWLALELALATVATHIAAPILVRLTDPIS